MKIALYIVSILLSLSCTKLGKNIYVSGRVVNPVTNKGIPNIEVELLKPSKTLALSSGFTGVKSVYTDSDGRFEISRLGGVKSYTIAVRLPVDMYSIGWLTDLGYNLQDLGVKKGKKMNVDYHAVPYGELNSHVENINCAGVTDSMQLRKKYQFSDWDSYWSPYKIGCYNNTSITPTIFPMGYYYSETKVTRAGITTYIYDTVFVSENGISFLEVLY